MVYTHWGGVVENNHFGTHEFMLLCELLDCEPYICGNVGSVKHACRHMDGLSLHYYTVPGSWQEKGSAVDFREQEWFLTMKKALHMDELITKHSTIMDKYDPAKRVGMIIDEWGTWYDVEPGTNPGFLYQQNTIRDALVAGLHFNIFHNHAERVHMTNIAQTVNVLQAMILTEGGKMLLTPTYHVFDMFKVHQDAELLAAAGTSIGSYEYGGETPRRRSPYRPPKMQKAGFISVWSISLPLTMPS